MYRSKESAAFAELLAEVFPTDEERAAHGREVAELVASIETQTQPRGRVMLRSEAGRMTRAAPGDFERLCADIEREAHDEGPRAFQELEHRPALLSRRESRVPSTPGEPAHGR
jgi:hypothetical protein